jgi:hypothetical protein
VIAPVLRPPWHGRLGGRWPGVIAALTGRETDIRVRQVIRSLQRLAHMRAVLAALSLPSVGGAPCER